MRFAPWRVCTLGTRIARASTPRRPFVTAAATPCREPPRWSSSRRLEAIPAPRERLRARLDRDVALRGEAARTTAILWLAMADVAVNRTESALARLQAVREPSSEFWFWLQLPEFDPLRADPRFVRLAEATRPQ